MALFPGVTCYVTRPPADESDRDLNKKTRPYVLPFATDMIVKICSFAGGYKNPTIAGLEIADQCDHQFEKAAEIDQIRRQK